jgi:hypothetical protein
MRALFAHRASTFRRIAINCTLLTVLALQFTLGRTVHASVSCESMFRSVRLASSLPLDIQSEFASLRPRLQKRFEKRFDRRGLISAENEAARIVAALLLEVPATNSKPRPLVRESTRWSSIDDVLQARLRQEDRRVQLEQRLIEIGYGEGSLLSQKWSGFRQKHSRALSMIFKFSKNAASTMFLGAPLFLRSAPPRNFSVPKHQQPEWSKLRKEFEEKIGTRNPRLIRQFKIEAAVDLAGRIAAAVILAIIIDELLSGFWTDWKVVKLNALTSMTFGHIGKQGHSELERLAFENWKDVVEEFTGTRPSDESDGAIEMLARIRGASREDLWLHVHQQVPLADDAANRDETPNLPPTKAEEVDQMFLTPMLER